MGLFGAPLIPLAWPLVQAGVAAVGSAAILISSGNGGNGNGSASGNSSSNGNGSSSASDASRSNTNNGSTSESNRRETEDSGASGNGNGGRGDGNGDRKKTDHEMDNQSEGEENDDENQTQQVRTSKRKVCTAWLEPVDYPKAPEMRRDPSEAQFFIRLQLPYYFRLNGETFFPRQHLIYRSRMFFYGIGRLQKLCNELGLKMKDICKFGTSVYKDARPGRLNQAPDIHAAHVFPVTDFSFDLIRERIRQLNPNKTQEQIHKLILDLENILKNMVGQTDYVHRAFNASGTVGRDLDNFLRDFIQENRTVNTGNIEQVVNSLIERLRSAINVELPTHVREEIEATIRTIQNTNANEWQRLFNDGLNGVHDDHYNKTRRTIDGNIKESCKNSQKLDKVDKKNKKKD